MDGIKLTSRTISEHAALRLVEYDTYGRRMAACSGDNELAVFDRAGGNTMWECSSSWQPQGDGRVTQVAWAHAEFGQLLAVASDRGEVAIYEEPGCSDDQQDDQPGAAAAWELRVRSHDAACSISDIRFGPKQLGLFIAACYDDGYVRLYKSPEVLSPSALLLDNDFRAARHGAAASCVAWRPWSAGVSPALLVGTTDGAAVWAYSPPTNKWRVSVRLSDDSASSTAAGAAAVAAVAWAPTLGRPTELVAVAQGSLVSIFSLSGAVDALSHERLAALEHPAPVWKAQWDMLGRWLATSSEDGCVRLWRPDLAGDWTLLHRIGGSSGGGDGMAQ